MSGKCQSRDNAVVMNLEKDQNPELSNYESVVQDDRPGFGFVVVDLCWRQARVERASRKADHFIAGIGIAKSALWEESEIPCKRRLRQLHTESMISSKSVSS